MLEPKTLRNKTALESELGSRHSSPAEEARTPSLNHLWRESLSAKVVEPAPAEPEVEVQEAGCHVSSASLAVGQVGCRACSGLAVAFCKVPETQPETEEAGPQELMDSAPSSVAWMTG